MFRVAAVSLFLALAAALLGFRSVLGYSWEGARIPFFVFAVVGVLALVAGSFRWRSVLN